MERKTYTLKKSDGIELDLSIVCNEKLTLKLKNLLNPFIALTFTSTYEQMIKSNGFLVICSDLKEITQFILERIEDNAYNLDDTDNGLILKIAIPGFKKSLSFEFQADEVKDPKAMILELSQMVTKLTKLLNVSNFYQTSQVLYSNEFATINQWIDPKKNLKLILLYSGEKNGFASSVFHQKCNGKSSTLTLITSHLDFRFGGYTSIAWDSSGSYKQDQKAFLFSLTRKLKFPAKPNTSNNVYCHGSYGPTFGSGHDLYIANTCASDFSSYSNIGNEYSPDGIGEIKNNEVLAGTYNFFVKHIEVYQVELN